jgi:hypothetical protein
MMALMEGVDEVGMMLAVGSRFAKVNKYEVSNGNHE